MFLYAVIKTAPIYQIFPGYKAGYFPEKGSP